MTDKNLRPGEEIMNEEIYEKVIACIEDACEMEFTDITASSRLREDLQMD